MIKSKASGRICLFGEHQDYLNHPVIPAAIDLYFYIEGKRRNDNKFIIKKLDLYEKETFNYPAKGLIQYEKPRDYFKSCLNVLRKAGIQILHGAEVKVWSQIPLKAGASSSSALCVAWIKFLLELFNSELRNNKIKIGELSYIAEVEEFKEPGGRMDQYISSLGGIFFLDFKNKKFEKLRSNLNGFILIDSLEKKDTLGVLKRVKEGQIKALNLIKEKHKNLMILKEKDLNICPLEIRNYGIAAVKNYQITLMGRKLLNKGNIDREKLGYYFWKQHKILRDYLKISTKKIDKALNICLENGAFGGKINGSGLGGTFFVYSPENKIDTIIEKLKKIKVKVYKVKIT